MTDIFLRPGAANPADVTLRDPTLPDAGGAASIVGAGQIASAEACGQPALSVSIAATGIASAEALGQPAISVTLASAGIGSAESFGALDLQIVVAASGIASGEALGQPTVSVPGAAWDILDAGGIVSGEAFGLPVVAPYVAEQPVSGFASWTKPRAAKPHLLSAVGGIASGEAFGRPVIAAGQRSKGRIRREARELGIPI